MNRRSRAAGRARLAAATALACAAAAPALPGDTPVAPTRLNVRIGWPTTAAAVEKALSGARARLADPRCAALVDDFADRAGRPLAEALEEQGGSFETHLGSLFFYDGSTRGQCRAARTLAFTSPGSHVVFVCGEKFSEAHAARPDHAEAYLIHEVLHTLGLDEDPPTPDEITEAVVDRCLAQGD